MVSCMYVYILSFERAFEICNNTKQEQKQKQKAYINRVNVTVNIGTMIKYVSNDSAFIVPALYIIRAYGCRCASRIML